MAKTINMECPICKKKVLFVGVHDDEGNYHGLVGCEYENDPWSGLSYALHHDGWGDCPLCTDGAYSTMGGMLFDTAEDAISAPTPSNEWVSVEDELPENNTQVLMWSTRWKIAEAGSYCNQHFWVYSEIGDGYIADNITHWMPLPVPPGKDNNVPTKSQNELLTPCDVCRFSPPSSGDGKPCCVCPADRRPPEGEANA